ncbi:hypothetical protein D3C81_1907670 [compost metagenome]
MAGLLQAGQQVLLSILPVRGWYGDRGGLQSAKQVRQHEKNRAAGGQATVYLLFFFLI